jgi:sarcosine oxidase gamma subunit
MDRWLIIASPPAGMVASAAFAITDVTGKWRELRLTGPAAKRLLANCVDVEELFAQGSCARTALFDCPAVLRKSTDGYSIWIERSYLPAFITAAEQADAL